MNEREHNLDKQTNRQAEIDVARSLSMLWIVGFWHLSNYYALDVDRLDVITNGVLALFFFISARLSARRRLVTIEDSIRFISHRLISLYPLLFVSGITLWFFGFYNTKFDLISNLLCISPLYNNVTQTIWFAIILVLFYFLTPIIIADISIKKKALIALFIYAVLVYERLFIGTFDMRLSEYISVYLLGLIIPNNLYSKLVDKWYFGAVGIIGFVVFCFSPFSIPILSSLLSNSLFIMAALFLCKRASSISFLSNIFYHISISSACAYFFHRQVYGLLVMIIPATPVTAYLVYLPIVLVLSYFLQISYNHILRAVKIKLLLKRPQ